MATTMGKAEVIDLVRENFKKAASVVLVDYERISVPKVTELRLQFRKVGVEYRVVKNTLIKHALAGSAIVAKRSFTDTLKGMTGVAWSYEDPSAAAKVIQEFRKLNKKDDELTVKCGVLDGEVLTAEQVERQLTSLPSKDGLRGMLLAQLLAPAQSLVRQLTAPTQNLLYALDARARQLEGGGS